MSLVEHLHKLYKNNFISSTQIKHESGHLSYKIKHYRTHKWCNTLFVTLLKFFEGGKAVVQRVRKCHPLRTASSLGLSVTWRISRQNISTLSVVSSSVVVRKFPVSVGFWSILCSMARALRQFHMSCQSLVWSSSVTRIYTQVDEYCRKTTMHKSPSIKNCSESQAQVLKKCWNSVDYYSHVCIYNTKHI